METTNQILANKLKNRTLWFDGDSTFDPSNIIDALSSGLSCDTIYVTQITDEIRKYNSLVNSQEQIKIKTGLKPLDFSWNIPEYYKTLNITQFLIDTLEQHHKHEQWSEGQYQQRIDRVYHEFKLYSKYKLIDILRTLIYIINTLQNNNIVWGVGRGSSVASYILYLIGVHDIDSVYFDLEITDFLRP